MSPERAKWQRDLTRKMVRESAAADYLAGFKAGVTDGDIPQRLDRNEQFRLGLSHGKESLATAEALADQNAVKVADRYEFPPAPTPDIVEAAGG